MHGKTWVKAQQGPTFLVIFWLPAWINQLVATRLEFYTKTGKITLTDQQQKRAIQLLSSSNGQTVTSTCCDKSLTRRCETEQAPAWQAPTWHATSKHLPGPDVSLSRHLPDVSVSLSKRLPDVSLPGEGKEFFCRCARLSRIFCSIARCCASRIMIGLRPWLEFPAESDRSDERAAAAWFAV